MDENIKITPIPILKDNYVWCIIDQLQSEALIVDPGSAQVVQAYLKRNKLNLKGILITHHHWDHTNGARELKNIYKIPVYASKLEKVTEKTMEVSDGETITINGFPLALKAMLIPGHTLGHLAYYNEEMVFCGDTLFASGCGKLFEGTPKQMYDSLQKIAFLPVQTKIYCGHEYTLQNLRFAEAVEPTNQKILERIAKVSSLRKQNKPTLPSLLQEEMETNPFLRCDQTKVKESVEKQSGRTLNDPIEVFAALRYWKDNFL